MLLMLLACTGSNPLGGSIISDDTAALAENVSTVIEVSFTLSESAEVSVSYTLSEGETLNSPSRALDAGNHMMRILGITGATEVSWAVVAVDSSGGTNNGDGGEIRTGNLPSSVPTFNISEHVPENTDEPWMVGAALSTDANDVQFIINRDGDVVWYHETTGDLVSPWAEPAVDGQGGVLVNSFQEDFCTDVGQVIRYNMSGQEVEATVTPEGHHVFVQHEDGTIAYIARDIRDHEDYPKPVCGDKVVEIAPDGTSRELFTAWDHFEVVSNGGMQQDFYCDCLDWTHGNMLAWNASTSSYLLSFANTNTIIEFDRESGAALRQFGDEPGSYEFSPPIAAFARQHGGYYTDEGTLILTQTNQTIKETTAVEYLIDDDALLLTQDWVYGIGEGYYALALGEPHRLENQNTLVNFGSEGLMQEVTSVGTVVWEAGLDVGSFLGRTTLINDIYDLDVAD
jgi:hypothetical protein